MKKNLNLSTLFWRFKYFGRHCRGNQLFLITDHQNWIFDRIVWYIADSLKEDYGISTYTDVQASQAKRQIIHFINRYAYFNKFRHSLHHSNHILLTWFHGDPSDPNPAIQQLFTALDDAQKTIRKIVVSCQITKQSLLNFGIAEAKLVMIPLGVDLVKFRPVQSKTRDLVRTRLGIPENAVCIGSFQKDGAGWELGLEPKSEKGPDVFLEVIHGLFSYYPNLFVILTGPARGYVKQGLEKMGIPYRHHCLSDYYDIVDYYHALDVYLITSRCEGGPASVLESWATGTPLVSTRVGMAADLIMHGDNGMLAEIEDVQNLVQHTRAIVEDHSLRKRCCQMALEDVQQFAWPRIVEQYYHKLYLPCLK